MVSHQILLTIRHEKRDFESSCNSLNNKKRTSLLSLDILYTKLRRKKNKANRINLQFIENLSFTFTKFGKRVNGFKNCINFYLHLYDKFTVYYTYYENLSVNNEI